MSVQSHSKIRCLSLDNIALDDSAWSWFLRAMSELPLLSHFSASNTQMDDSRCRQLLESKLLNAYPGLSTSPQHSPWNRSTGFASRHLEYLDLSDNQLTSRVGVCVGRFITQQQYQRTLTLTHLDLSGNRLGEHGFQLLAPWLRNTSLKVLRLRLNHSTSAAVAEVIVAVSGLASLDLLDVSLNGRHSTSPSAVLCGMLAPSNIEHLDLSGCHLFEGEMVGRILLYSTGETLRTVRLSQNADLGDGFCHSVLETPWLLSRVVTLDLSKTQLSDRGCKLLNAAIVRGRKLPSLRCFSARDNLLSLRGCLACLQAFEVCLASKGEESLPAQTKITGVYLDLRGNALVGPDADAFYYTVAQGPAASPPTQILFSYLVLTGGSVSTRQQDTTAAEYHPERSLPEILHIIAASRPSLSAELRPLDAVGARIPLEQSSDGRIDNITPIPPAVDALATADTHFPHNTDSSMDDTVPSVRCSEGGEAVADQSLQVLRPDKEGESSDHTHHEGDHTSTRQNSTPSHSVGQVRSESASRERRRRSPQVSICDASVGSVPPPPPSDSSQPSPRAEAGIDSTSVSNANLEVRPPRTVSPAAVRTASPVARTASPVARTASPVVSCSQSKPTEEVQSRNTPETNHVPSGVAQAARTVEAPATVVETPLPLPASCATGGAPEREQPLQATTPKESLLPTVAESKGSDINLTAPMGPSQAELPPTITVTSPTRANSASAESSAFMSVREEAAQPASNESSKIASQPTPAPEALPSQQLPPSKTKRRNSGAGVAKSQGNAEGERSASSTPAASPSTSPNSLMERRPPKRAPGPPKKHTFIVPPFSSPDHVFYQALSMCSRERVLESLAKDIAQVMQPDEEAALCGHSLQGAPTVEIYADRSLSFSLMSTEQRRVLDSKKGRLDNSECFAHVSLLLTQTQEEHGNSKAAVGSANENSGAPPTPADDQGKDSAVPNGASDTLNQKASEPQSDAQPVEPADHTPPQAASAHTSPREQEPPHATPAEVPSLEQEPPNPTPADVPSLEKEGPQTDGKEAGAGKEAALDGAGEEAAGALDRGPNTPADKVEPPSIGTSEADTSGVQSKESTEAGEAAPHAPDDAVAPPADGVAEGIVNVARASSNEEIVEPSVIIERDDVPWTLPQAEEKSDDGHPFMVFHGILSGLSAPFFARCDASSCKAARAWARRYAEAIFESESSAIPQRRGAAGAPTGVISIEPAAASLASSSQS